MSGCFFLVVFSRYVLHIFDSVRKPHLRLGRRWAASIRRAIVSPRTKTVTDSCRPLFVSGKIDMFFFISHIVEFFHVFTMYVYLALGLLVHRFPRYSSAEALLHGRVTKYRNSEHITLPQTPATTWIHAALIPKILVSCHIHYLHTSVVR